jgi:hypothetical protein
LEVVVKARVESDLGRAVPSGNERLRTDIHRPAAGGPWPALLLRTPYGTAEPVLLKIARILARNGYAVVLQNVRGRYGSSGSFEPFGHEVEDGRATLEWLAAQPWCDGRVIGWGISYSTYTAAALCVGAPPAGIRLMGVVSVVGMANPYHHFYRGGAFVLHWALPWYLLISGPRSRKLEPRSLRLPALGPIEKIPDALGGSAGLWRDWLRWRSESDEYWRRRDLVPTLVDSRLPMLHIGGWYDFTIGSTLDLYRAMVASGAPGQRLIVGPWEHNQTAAALFRSLAAEGHDGDAGRAADAAWLAEEMLGALRAWLGEEALEPRLPVRVWLETGASGAWRNLESWPPPPHLGVWYLTSSETGEGRLAAAPSESTWAASLKHDPEDPVPSLGGRCWAMPGWTSAGPLDQASLATRRDLLMFSSPPLDQPVEICGYPQTVLWIERSGSAPSDCYAKLVDIHPDGRRTWVADGVLRSAWQAGTPQGREEVAIELGAVAHRFDHGHRLGLEVAASSFPQFDRSPENGILRLFHGAEHASRLLLPEMTEHPTRDAAATQNQENSRWAPFP